MFSYFWVQILTCRFNWGIFATSYVTAFTSYLNRRINECSSGNGPYLDSDGLSVSFWYRILNRALKHDRPCYNRWNSITSSEDIKSYGMHITMNECSTNAIKVMIRDSTLLYQVQWGSVLNASERWTHFMFTFSASKGIVLFSNGIEVAAKAVGFVSFWMQC